MLLHCKEDYRKLIEKLVKEGLDINSTYELIGHDIRARVTSTEEIIDIFELDKDVINGFVKAISNFDATKIGPYITEKYFLLMPSLKDAVLQLKLDSMGSRRCVITFPKEHCFQSIQFLVRENTIHVVCFMRSCDVVKNLPYDMWLCSFLADVFANYIEKTTNKTLYTHHNITMYFGSLHVFKEDLDNVF